LIFIYYKLNLKFLQMHKEQLLNNKNYGALQAIYYLFMVYPNSRFIRNLG